MDEQGEERGEQAAEPAVGELLRRVGAEQDERVVVTLGARRDETHGWVLLLGSALIGPSDMADLSWPEWADRETGQRQPVVQMLARRSRPVEQWRSFDHAVGDWRLLRFALRLDEFEPWLITLLRGGLVRLPVDSDAVVARPVEAEALVRLSPHRATSASRLAGAALRPVLGWVHPLTSTSAAAGAPLSDPPPADWDVDGVRVSGACRFLTGFSLPMGSAEPPLLPGLLVGRLERRAWLSGLRGAQPELETFDVSLGLDPARVSVRDLSLDVEESDRDGDVLAARRVQLGDLDLSRIEADSDRVVVKLPTLGRRLVRRVRLFDREGALLDSTNEFSLLESLVLAVSLLGGETAETTIGLQPTPIGLVARLGRLDQADEEWRDLLQAGVSGRVVAQGDGGAALLRRRLAEARGELRVFDPYFGESVDDWALLDDVLVPMRLLTTVGRNAAAPPSGAAGRAPGLQVRRWAPKTSRLKPPFHDRAYLWDGGGVSVGTSPTGLGARLSLVTDLDATLAWSLTAHFELWWTDSAFVDVP